MTNSPESLIDTHAHINDARLIGDIDNLLSRATEVGVQTIFAIGVTLESSRQCVALAEKYPQQIFAAVGIQPNHVHKALSTDWDEIVQLAEHPQVKAIGETGLDKYWKDAPFELQRDCFAKHMSLSRTLDKPFVVHMRDCGDEVLEMLQAARIEGPLFGVMHSFTGDLQLAKKCVELGLYISFAGMVTYKKSDDLRSVAASIPMDRMLIETDSPYLSPEPHRGKRPNEPAMVMHTASCLAKVCGMKYSDLAKQTTANARRLFKL